MWKSCLSHPVPTIVCGRWVIYYVIKYGRWRFVARSTLIIYWRESRAAKQSGRHFIKPDHAARRRLRRYAWRACDHGVTLSRLVSLSLAYSLTYLLTYARLSSPAGRCPIIGSPSTKVSPSRQFTGKNPGRIFVEYCRPERDFSGGSDHIMGRLLWGRRYFNKGRFIGDSVIISTRADFSRGIHFIVTPAGRQCNYDTTSWRVDRWPRGHSLLVPGTRTCPGYEPRDAPRDSSAGSMHRRYTKNCPALTVADICDSYSTLTSDSEASKL